MLGDVEKLHYCDIDLGKLLQQRCVFAGHHALFHNTVYHSCRHPAGCQTLLLVLRGVPLKKSDFAPLDESARSLADIVTSPPEQQQQ